MIDQLFIESVSKIIRSTNNLDIIKDFAQSFSHNQIECKKWLVEELLKVHNPKNICIIGSWYSTVLPYLLKDYNIYCYDIDPVLQPIANQFLQHTKIKGVHTCASMQELETNKWDTVINTSCEHMPDMKDYIKSQLPVYALQSNDYFAIKEHTNCKTSLNQFIDSTGLQNIMYSGTKKMKGYERYMVIGTL